MNRQSFCERLYAKLYRRIVSGKYRAGERITEMQIAQSEGISRAPVREALKMLADDRLVLLVPRSGCYVWEPDANEIAVLYDIRNRLEGLALEYAFDRLDPKEVRVLRKEFSRCRVLGKKALCRRAVDLDRRIHSMISEGSKSLDLRILLRKSRARIEVFRVQGATDEYNVKAGVQRHIGILDAILARDRGKASRLLAEDIEVSKNTLLAEKPASPGSHPRAGRVA